MRTRYLLMIILAIITIAAMGASFYCAVNNISAISPTDADPSTGFGMIAFFGMLGVFFAAFVDD